MKSALTASAHSRKRLSDSCRMTFSSVSGWHSRQLSTISATNSGWSPNTTAYSSRIAGLTHASMRPARPSAKMSADTLFSPGNVASFRMHVSRTTLKIRPGATQGPRTSLPFDERNRFPLRHRLSTILSVRPRQRRGELETNDFAFDYGCRIHDISVRKETDGGKRMPWAHTGGQPRGRVPTPDGTRARSLAVDRRRSAV